MESLARGGTRWKRFAVVMVPGVAATAAIGVALSQGALAASFSVSGQQFKLTAEQIEATGFTQYGAVDNTAKGAKPVTVVGMDQAQISGLCQSVVVPVPGFGDVSMKLGAGEGESPVVAKKLYVDADSLSTDATFKNIDIGVSVSDSNIKGPGPNKGDKYLPGSFAQAAESATLTDVKQRAWSTTAGTFKLSGLHMSVKTGKHECY
ncbi:DUF6230 family protein [Streptomyces sp. TR06-5]|uniref:DUF6230 family protein n=1 Tax=unclassified Streptomyces TaxID=2593676 RepID=UPI0039A1819E